MNNPLAFVYFVNKSKFQTFGDLPFTYLSQKLQSRLRPVIKVPILTDKFSPREERLKQMKKSIMRTADKYNSKLDVVSYSLLSKKIRGH